MMIITLEIMRFTLLLLKFILSPLFNLKNLFMKGHLSYMKYPIFLCITLFSFFVYLRAKKKTNFTDSSFWEKENAANSVRKKSLDSLAYIIIPAELLPLQNNTTNEELLEYQNTIDELSKKIIVNLTGITNTDLKFKYGAPNINILMEYDQNFTFLARTLSNWAFCLYKLGLTEESKTVLEFGIFCRTDVKKHYVLLAEIYKEESCSDKIDHLIEVAKTLNSIMKNSIITELKNIRDY